MPIKMVELIRYIKKIIEKNIGHLKNGSKGKIV